MRISDWSSDVCSSDLQGETPPPEGAWRQEVMPSPALLFRYSALTFNGHRIHYDHPYTTQEEGYPGLTVHGPLLATLMIGLLRRHLPQSSEERRVGKEWVRTCRSGWWPDH